MYQFLYRRKKRVKTKMYIHVPFLSRYKSTIEYFSLGAGMSVVWSKHNFKISSACKSYFPRKISIFEGRHLFSIHIGIMYWNISFTFYKPEKYK